MRQDRSQPPTDPQLQAQLAGSHGAYRALLDRHPDLEPEWRWNGQKHGWSLKLRDGKRNLCLVKPADGHFTVGFTFGHDAVERALASELPPAIRGIIAAAHTDAGGRSFQIEVRAEDDLGPVHALLAIRRGPDRNASRPSAPAGRVVQPPAALARPPAQPRGDRRAPAQRRGRSPG